MLLLPEVIGSFILLVSMDYCLVYFSFSTTPFTESELKAILTKSRLYNQQNGITGVLLYVKGSIVQVLEGEKSTVESLYQRILEDPRHQNVSTVLARPITQRLFAHWAMGFETITIRQLQEITDLVDLTGQDGPGTQDQDPLLLRTIKLFYESNRFN